MSPEEGHEHVSGGLEHLFFNSQPLFIVVLSGEEKAPGRPYSGLLVPKRAYKKAGEGFFARM